MSEFSDIIISGVVVLLLSSVLSSVLSSLLSRLCFSRPVNTQWQTSQTQLSATAETRLLTLWALQPWLTVLWVTIFLVHPGLAGFLFHDHCHGDVCGPHIPDVGHASLSAGVIATLITFAIAALLFATVRRLQKNHQRLQTIRQLSKEDSLNQVQLIDSPLLLAWCVGLWRPQVFISRGLTETLNDEELQLVLLHEFSHAMHRDNLNKLLLRTATVLWLPAARRRLLQRFAAACELRSDLAVIEQGFSRADIQRVLGKLQSSCQPGDSADAQSNDRHQRSDMAGTVNIRQTATDTATDTTTHSATGITDDTEMQTDFPVAAFIASLLLLASQIAFFSYFAHPVLDMLFL